MIFQACQHQTPRLDELIHGMLNDKQEKHSDRGPLIARLLPRLGSETEHAKPGQAAGLFQDEILQDGNRGVLIALDPCRNQ